MITILLISVIVIFLIIFLKSSTQKPHNFPPGPPNIPIFGSYLYLLLLDYKYLHIAALKLTNYYRSKILGLYIGDFPTVVANSKEGVMEILRRPEFDGRPDIFVARLRHPEYKRNGIIFQDGEQWKDQRRFMLRHLRDFGFGRRFDELEKQINEELIDLIDLIRNGPKFPHEAKYVKNNHVLLPYVLCACMGNCFLQVLSSERYPREQQEVLFEMGRAAMEFQRNGDDYGLLLSIIPWIRYFFPNFSHYKPLRDTNSKIYEFIKQLFEKNIQTYDENVERNFIDVYLKKIYQQRLENETPKDVQHDDFIMACTDFFFPPVSAVPSQLSFLVQHLLLRPDILKKIQAEIDDVVGSGRLPTLDDRKDMNFTEATVREIMRLETAVPSDLPHFAVEDTTFLGYDIPKGTIMIPSLHAFHNDENIWKDPRNFRPERFLDENGKLSLKKDTTVPFGGGRRLCAGETFARNMMFLLVAALCQNFNIVLGPGQKLPDLSKNLSGITLSTYDFWVKLDPR